jgi:hypothetical protein
MPPLKSLESMKLIHSFLAFAFYFTPLSHAHGTPESPGSLAQRHEFASKASNLLARNCNARLHRRSEISRRSGITDAFVNKYRLSRGLQPSFQTRQDSTAICVLTPKEELGPYCEIPSKRSVDVGMDYVDGR